jgi:hypothetical protein
MAAVAQVQLSFWEVPHAELGVPARVRAAAADADGVLLVHDVGAARASMDVVDAWRDALAPLLGPSAVRYLLVHKADDAERAGGGVLTDADYDAYARVSGMNGWRYTSARGSSVREAVCAAVDDILTLQGYRAARGGGAGAGAGTGAEEAWVPGVGVGADRALFGGEGAAAAAAAAARPLAYAVPRVRACVRACVREWWWRARARAAHARLGP